MTEPVWSIDARTGERLGQAATEADAADVDKAVQAAHETRASLADPATRAALLRAAARELNADAAEIIRTADSETALGVPRLTGELGRTTGQFEAFAAEVEDGGYLDVAIDHADPALTPPRPDLRRYRVPLGVVAVYAASNFPLAFSVPGGDTASALAAGCPVVVKAHPAHPATSQLCATALRRAAASVGLSEDVVTVVHGFDAGVALVDHPLVTAAGFTGSVRGGRALFDRAAARPVPIPFHGELGSLNPLIITEAAATERPEEIGTGLAGSVTLGTGQFCVKPGLVLLPEGEAGDAVLTALTTALGAAAEGVLLDDRIRDAFLAGVTARGALPEVTVPVAAGAGEGRAVVPGFVTVPAARLAEESHESLLEECFGPLTVVARYRDTADVERALASLTGSLTATVHIGAEEAAEETGHAAELLAALTPLAGRLLVNGWPTGVAVTTAQHHGGPYPAATSAYTSVGASAIGRWLRPVVHQSTPAALLPPALRDDNPLGLPRRVDGRWER
ncbi:MULTISPECIES: aldehyde dehydrogenase family protein [unclassified Streptomyces]|uniref:aldehyde dehydrogenase family protein n=2 Tax=Streptomyces TaxID=1883 RepID=UPI000CD5978A|nr:MULTISPECIES: aldehyde dehydrogenase family protein [unclassified Streptomyces]